MGDFNDDIRKERGGGILATMHGFMQALELKDVTTERALKTHSTGIRWNWDHLHKLDNKSVVDIQNGSDQREEEQGKGGGDEVVDGEG